MESQAITNMICEIEEVEISSEWGWDKEIVQFWLIFLM